MECKITMVNTLNLITYISTIFRRWLRLLFGREFALLDLLVLWDAIFADSDHFDLPNYVLVAMLIRIRDKRTKIYITFKNR